MTAATPGFQSMRVLLLSHYFPPMHDVGGLRAWSFARYLPDHGIQVDAVVGATTETTNGELLTELGSRVRVARVANWFAGPLDCSWSAVRAAWRLAKRDHYDLILATGPPWATTNAGLLLSTLTGIPLVAEFRDPWTRGALWGVHRGSPLARWLHRRCERAVLRRAIGIVCVSPAAVARIQGQVVAERRDRVVCIPNGHHELAASGASPAGRATRCVFAHVGKLHPVIRPPDLVLDAFAIACRTEGFAADAQLVQTGRSGGLEEAARARGLGHQVVVNPPVPIREALRLMRMADVLVLVNFAADDADEVETAKVYDYLAARRPILGVVRHGCASANLLADVPNATVCGNDDPARVAEAMLTLWEAWCLGELEDHNVDLVSTSRRARAAELAAALRTLTTSC